MSENDQERTAEQVEQDRVDDLARQNEEVRRAEHPEEFDDDGEARAVAPVAPATGTGHSLIDGGKSLASATQRTDVDPAAASRAAVGEAADQRAEDLTTLEKLRAGARELERKIFGGGDDA